VLSHLPSTTFCWLPPESDPAGASIDAALIRRRSTNSLAVAASWPARTKPRGPSYRRSDGSVRFDRSDIRRIKPRLRRSSVV
jgi:hypothetical protein